MKNISPIINPISEPEVNIRPNIRIDGNVIIQFNILKNVFVELHPASHIVTEYMILIKK